MILELNNPFRSAKKKSEIKVSQSYTDLPLQMTAAKKDGLG